MFHIEIREGVQMAGAFNLGIDELREQLLIPMRSREVFRYQQREWDPLEAQLTVFEAPELRPDQIGMGRGWPTVQKIGTDVTRLVLSQVPAAPASAAGRPAAIDQLKERLIGRLSAGPVALPEIVAIAADLMPDAAPGEQVAASHRAASELLHSGGARLAPPA